MWSQLESGPYHRETERGEGKMRVSREAFSLSLCLSLPFILPMHPGQEADTLQSTVFLSSVNCSVFIVIVSGQDFQQRTSPDITSHVTPLRVTKKLSESSPFGLDHMYLNKYIFLINL